MLAAYALKFSFFALLLFTSLVMQRNDLIVLLACLGVLSGSVNIASTIDFKKIAANMSVAHMSAAIILLLVQSQSTFKLGLLS